MYVSTALGATVIAAAGSAAKLDIAKRCGADFTVDYTKGVWLQGISCQILSQILPAIQLDGNKTSSR